MIQRWIESIGFVSRTRAAIERRSVARARASLAQRSPAANHYPTGQRQLLVDVSVIQYRDARSGIQRVVRAVFHQLLYAPPAGYCVRPVCATRKRAYRYSSWHAAEFNMDGAGKVSIRPGDVFLGLDLCAHIIPAHRKQMIEWKAQGASLHFVVYDLLPLHHPDWFSAKLVVAFHRWIKAVAVLADSTFCISQSVESDLGAWLETRYNLTPGSIPARVIPMGWDLAATDPSRGLPPNFEPFLAQLKQRKTVLMVGTLEPRKGHAQVLEAFDRLWHDGNDCNLLIVGRPGWKTQDLQARLNTHPQRNEKLFWLDDASDEALLALYQACAGVILASLAEGFGLPLAEALGHDKPVLARDLPVFRQQAHGNIDYFSDRDGQGLAAVLVTWLERIENHKTIQAHREDLPAWRDTVAAIVAGLGVTPRDLASSLPAGDLEYVSVA